MHTYKSEHVYIRRSYCKRNPIFKRGVAERSVHVNERICLFDLGAERQRLFYDTVRIQDSSVFLVCLQGRPSAVSDKCPHYIRFHNGVMQILQHYKSTMSIRGTESQFRMFLQLLLFHMFHLIVFPFICLCIKE